MIVFNLRINSFPSFSYVSGTLFQVDKAESKADCPTVGCSLKGRDFTDFTKVPEPHRGTQSSWSIQAGSFPGRWTHWAAISPCQDGPVLKPDNFEHLRGYIKAFLLKSGELHRDKCNPFLPVIIQARVELVSLTGNLAV